LIRKYDHTLKTKEFNVYYIEGLYFEVRIAIIH